MLPCPRSLPAGTVWLIFAELRNLRSIGLKACRPVRHRLIHLVIVAAVWREGRLIAFHMPWNWVIDKLFYSLIYDIDFVYTKVYLQEAPVVELQFEWDVDKAAQNIARHGVSFLTAAEIFANEFLERIDDREDYGEERFIALGRAGAEIYRVAYTWRGETVIRIITAQKASRHERETYYRKIFA